MKNPDPKYQTQLAAMGYELSPPWHYDLLIDMADAINDASDEELETFLAQQERRYFSGRVTHAGTQNSKRDVQVALANGTSEWHRRMADQNDFCTRYESTTTSRKHHHRKHHHRQCRNRLYVSS